MFKLSAAVFLLTAIDLGSTTGGIEDNKAIKAFYGTYVFIYAWPMLAQTIPDCSLVQYRKLRYTHRNPYTCTCRRNNTNLALVEQRSHYAGWPLLVDIVEYPEHVKPALDDRCHCSPNVELAFAVFRKLNRNCMVVYEKFRGATSAYLLCKKVPKQYEIDVVIKYMAELGDEPGQLMCQNPEG